MGGTDLDLGSGQRVTGAWAPLRYATTGADTLRCPARGQPVREILRPFGAGMFCCVSDPRVPLAPAVRRTSLYPWLHPLTPLGSPGGRLD